LKRSALALAILLSVTVVAGVYPPGSRAQQPSNAEQEILAVEALRIQYSQEPSRWKDRIDDSAVFTQGSGKVNTKAEILKLLHQAEWAYDGSAEMRDARFKQFGDTAVLTYVYLRKRQEGEYTIRQHVRKTAVYQRRGSHWQIIASTAVALPNADRVQKSVNPKILDSYVGLYEGDLRITREGTRLMAQSPEDQEKIELLAVSNEAFAIRGEGDSILFVFEKSTDGRMQLRAHNIGGSESVAKRHR